MAGKIKRMIDVIIDTRSNGNTTIRGSVATKLILKGFNPAKFDAGTPDDPALIAKLRTIAQEMGVAV